MSDTFKNHNLSATKADDLYLPIALINSWQLKQQKDTSVKFSGDTSQEMRENHANINQEDYLLVQDILNKEELVEEANTSGVVMYNKVNTI